MSHRSIPIGEHQGCNWIRCFSLLAFIAEGAAAMVLVFSFFGFFASRWPRGSPFAISAPADVGQDSLPCCHNADAKRLLLCGILTFTLLRMVNGKSKTAGYGFFTRLLRRAADAE